MTPLQQKPAARADVSQGLFKLSFTALGSPCMIQFRARDGETARAFRMAALEWLHGFEARFSRFRPDSELSRVNAAAGNERLAISREFAEMLDLCERVHALSGGIHDPTSLPLTLLWDRAAAAGELPGKHEIAATLDLVGWKKVERTPGHMRLPRAGMALDFGGFGKEYAVDRVALIAEDFGIRDILIDFGRDIATRGSPPDFSHWVIGVEDAGTPDKPLLRAALSGLAMATSGNYRRYRTIRGTRYGHQIDPRTGEPVSTAVEAVTCIANTCLVAGLFAQAAFIAGERDALGLIESQPDVEGVIQISRKPYRTRKFQLHEI
jgi:thiamine biosynthesis lipoprotein